jgi:hypothetical protein
MKLEDFVEGERYTFKQLSMVAGYGPTGGYFQRGIILAPSNNPWSIMIKINLAKKLYDDSYTDGADCFYYIGDGQPETGHQKLVRGNKIMVENQELPVYLFVRYEHEKKGMPWTFRGVWRITGVERDFLSTKFIPEGERQRVFRFKLAKLSILPYEGEIFTEFPKIDDKLSELSYIRATPALLKVIVPRHKKLTNQFRRWLIKEGFKDIHLERNNIDVDFRFESVRHMAELKIVHDLTTTKAIREAMGQVLEYNFFNARTPFDKWIVLLDETPKESDIHYMSRLEKELQVPLNLGWKDGRQFEFVRPLI